MRKTKFTIFLAIISFALFGAAGVASAANIYVDNTLLADCTTGNYSTSARTCTGSDGNAYATIQAAVDMAQPGDIVNIHAGTYTDTQQITSSAGRTYLPEDLNRYANIWLKTNGTSANKITIRSIGDGDVIVDSQLTAEYSFYAISKPYYRIEGIKFINAKKESMNYRGSSAANIELINNTFSSPSINKSSGYGVRAQGPNWVITGNTIDVPGFFVGLDMAYGGDNIVSNNTITGPDYGIYLHIGTDRTVVESNQIIGTSGDLTGIFFRDSNDVILRNNLIRGTYINYMIDHQDIGQVTSGNKIYNNTIHCGSSARGINISDGPNIIPEITNNIIYNCFVGIDSDAPVINLPQGQPKTNIIYGATYQFYASTQNNWPVGDGNLTLDPLFVSPGNDYSLQSVSPAKDIGVTLVGFSVDKNGISRPQGVAWDIGAFEYISFVPDTTPPSAPQGLVVN